MPFTRTLRRVANSMASRPTAWPADEAVQRIAGFGGGVDSQRATTRFNETRLRKER